MKTGKLASIIFVFVLMTSAHAAASTADSSSNHGWMRHAAIEKAGMKSQFQDNSMLAREMVYHAGQACEEIENGNFVDIIRAHLQLSQALKEEKEIEKNLPLGAHKVICHYGQSNEKYSENKLNSDAADGKTWLQEIKTLFNSHPAYAGFSVDIKIARKDLLAAEKALSRSDSKTALGALSDLEHNINFIETSSGQPWFRSIQSFHDMDMSMNKPQSPFLLMDSSTLIRKAIERKTGEQDTQG